MKGHGPCEVGEKSGSINGTLLQGRLTVLHKVDRHGIEVTLTRKSGSGWQDEIVTPCRCWAR